MRFLAALSLLALPAFGTEPELRSIGVTVDSIRSFVHEERCGGKTCDGYLVSAHNLEANYALICERYEYDAKAYVNAALAKTCRRIHLGSWYAKTDDEQIQFRYGESIIATYEIWSATPRLKGE